MQRRWFFQGLMTFVPLWMWNKVGRQGSVRQDEGYVVKQGMSRLGRSFHMKGVTDNILDLKIAGADTGGDVAVFEQTGRTPHGGPPLHIHLYQDEWFIVIEGRYRFKVGDQEFHLSTGDTIFLPRQVPHAFIQLSQKGRLIVSYLPAGKMEDFFSVTANWKSPPDAREIARVFKDHDMEIVGPPLDFRPGE